jgi:hypothetical protein
MITKKDYLFIVLRFAWIEVKTQYRRSLLGPLWISINMFISIFALGFIFSNLFGLTLYSYLPFVYTGLLVWNLISVIITESVNMFINGSIKNFKFPLLFFSLRLTFKNLILFWHNFLIYFFIVIFINSSILNFKFFLFFLAIPFFFINAVALSFYIGIISLRYRDLGQIILNFTYLLFLVTPVFWDSNLLSGKRLFLVSFNPFYHFINTMREPLLGNYPSITSYIVVFLVTLFNILMAYIVYRTKHQNKVFWI